MSDETSLHQYNREFNPFWRAKGTESLSRRNYLFYTQRRSTPGTMSKFSLGFMTMMTFYGVWCIKSYRMEKERVKMIEFEYQRRTTPFLQAIEDRRNLVFDQRESWLRKELFKDNPEELKALERLYNNPMSHVGDHKTGNMYMGGVPRSYKGHWRQNQDWMTGVDLHRKNIPNEHF